MRVTRGSGKLQGTVRGQEVVLTSRSLGRTFKLTHDDNVPFTLSAKMLVEAWTIMRPNTTKNQKMMLRKEFNLEIYMLE